MDSPLSINCYCYYIILVVQSYMNHTKYCSEEAATLRKSEHVCVDDLPPIVLIFHNVLIIIHVVTRKVILQHTSL